eukprot:NODE_18142_length_908_cov_3.349552.p1 GENE.NODE_18142_length_908_cov_3.349552~~NODE_18142_length_908_cov_3.349552.p1  ORF type:complete len:265 (+),score=67.40 NODE_18142_length_908_cov_3.349552:111-797(+)
MGGTGAVMAIPTAVSVSAAIAAATAAAAAAAAAALGEGTGALAAEPSSSGVLGATPPPHAPFEVRLEGDLAQLGLVQLGSRVVVAGELSEAFRNWNRSAPTDLVAPYDEVVEANGARGVEALLKVLAVRGDLQLLLRHSELRRVCIAKRGRRLGLRFKKRDKDALRISSVNEGAAQDWNDEHSALRLREGDFVVEVNGCRGPPAEMMTQLAKLNELELHVLRSLSQDT